MPSDTATDVAQAILEDRRGADYYKEADILAGFLEGKFGVSREDATRAARAISDDRSGADYYQDAKILAEFLDGQLGSA